MLTMYFHSPDGINVNLYKTGEKYDLPESVACHLVEHNLAAEDKDMGAAPETKTATPSVKKKRRRK